MRNKNLTVKDRNLIKGALRRVFSRSETRKIALARYAVKHHDPERPRVKKWSKCPECQELTPTYKMQVDHLYPIVPVDQTLELMSWDDLIDNLWCDTKDLQALCPICHTLKTNEERKLRMAYKKERNKK